MSLPITIILLCVAAGILAGILSGMLGVGGGIIFVPILHFLLEPYSIASDHVFYVLCNSLAMILVVGIMGAYKHHKMKNNHIPSALVTGVSAIITAMLLTFIIDYFSWKNPFVFKLIFAAILFYSFLRMTLGIKNKDEEYTIVNIPSWKRFIPVGFLTGIITAISGLGGGIVMVPYFNKILKLPIKFSTGLSISVIPFIALPLLLFYGFKMPENIIFPNKQTGYILWPFVLPIVVGTILGMPLGIKIAQKLSNRTITFIFLLFIVITLIKLFI